MTAAFNALSVRGTLGFVGVSPAGTRVDVDPWGILLGRSVRGNMEGDAVPDVFLPYLLDLHVQGRFPFDKLITNCGGLEQINDAVEAIESGEVTRSRARCSWGETVTNVAFGEPKRNRLFIYATTSLYSDLLPVNGAPTVLEASAASGRSA